MSPSPTSAHGVPRQVNPRSARTIPTPMSASVIPAICRKLRCSFRAARANHALQRGMVASIRAPRDASVRRRLALKVSGKMEKKIAPRSMRKGRSRLSTRRTVRARMNIERDSTTPPRPNRRTARLRGGMSCTATRVATTEAPNRIAAKEAAIFPVRPPRTMGS